MAIEVEYISVVVKDSSIRNKYKGGIDQFMQDADSSHEEDGEIHALSFIDPNDASEYIDVLIKRGLTFKEDKKLIDIAVCDLIFGIMHNCDWLTIEEVKGCNPKVSLSPDKRSYTLESLIIYSNANERICPKPMVWQGLYDRLKGTERVGAGWEPPLPLILAAWSDSSHNEKKMRFIKHLEWADKQNQIKEIAEYIYRLKEKDWLHEDDRF